MYNIVYTVGRLFCVVFFFAVAFFVILLDESFIAFVDAEE